MSDLRYQPTKSQLYVLQKLLHQPTRWVERCTDNIVSLGYDTISWERHLQIQLPSAELSSVAPLSGRQDDSPNPALPSDDNDEYLVSLGYYQKERYPDLECFYSYNGDAVPIVGRDLRDNIIGVLATTRMHADKSLNQEDKNLLIRLAVQLSKMSADHAESLFKRSEDWLHEITNDEVLFENLKHLCRNRHIFVWVRGNTTRRVLVTARFTTNTPFPTFRSVVGRVVESWNPVYLLRWIAMVQGLNFAPLLFTLGGANHSNSYYLTVNIGEVHFIGLAYWKQIRFKSQHGLDFLRGKYSNALRDVDYSLDEYSMPHVNGKRILAAHSEEVEILKANQGLIDVGLSPTEYRVAALVVVSIVVALNIAPSIKGDQLTNLLPLYFGIVSSLLVGRTPSARPIGERIGRLLSIQLMAVSIFSSLYGIARAAETIDNTILISSEKYWQVAAFLSAYCSTVLIYIVFIHRRVFAVRNLVTGYLDIAAVRKRRQLQRRISYLVMILGLSLGIGFSEKDLVLATWVGAIGGASLFLAYLFVQKWEARRSHAEEHAEV